MKRPITCVIMGILIFFSLLTSGTVHSATNVVNSGDSWLDQLPLIQEGKTAGILTDMYKAKHTILYIGTQTLKNGTQGQIKVQYNCPNAKKVSQFYLGIFKGNDSGVCTYLYGYTYTNITGVTKKDFYLTYNKEDFKDQEYIYIDYGLSEEDDFRNNYGEGAFRIKNPDFKPKHLTGKYVIIANESVDGKSTASTGTFPAGSGKKNENEEQRKHYIDGYIPFDSKEEGKKLISNDSEAQKNSQSNYKEGSARTISVTNMATNKSEKIQISLAYSDEKSNIWVHNNQISKEDAKKIGKEFNEKIEKVVSVNFGIASDNDENEKINIVCYDIKDSYNPFAQSSTSVNGYFRPSDFSNEADSNCGRFLYIDTYPSMYDALTKDVSLCYSHIVHEYQHLVNYYQNYVKNENKVMDRWLDEGLSMAAEQIYTGKCLENRINDYNSSTEITNGRSLIYWNQNESVTSNYSLSYLFLQYLRIQCYQGIQRDQGIQSNQGKEIYKELMNLPSGDYKAIETLIHKYIDPKLTFGKFMVDFRTALLLNEYTGRRGFKGDPMFKGIKKRFYTGTGCTLHGGGAIVKDIIKTGITIPDNLSKDISYTVVTPSNTKPVINGVSNLTIKQYDKFDALKGVTAIDNEDWNITKQLKVTGTVNNKKPGTYTLTYKVTDQDKNTTTKQRKITVRSNTRPVIQGLIDQSIKLGEIFNAKKAITATDKEDGNLTSKIKITGKVDNKKVGAYRLTYKVTDSDGNTDTRIITVKVLKVFKKLSVDIVDNKQTAITGTGEYKAKVKAYVNNKKIGGSATVDKHGRYKLTVPKQKAGAKIVVVMAKDWYKTLKVSTTVLNTFGKITVNKVSRRSTYVSGKGEKGATIQLSINGKWQKTKVKVGSNKWYSIKISKQKAGTKLTLLMTKNGYRPKKVTTTVAK